MSYQRQQAACISTAHQPTPLAEVLGDCGDIREGGVVGAGGRGATRQLPCRKNGKEGKGPGAPTCKVVAVGRREGV